VAGLSQQIKSAGYFSKCRFGNMLNKDKQIFLWSVLTYDILYSGDMFAKSYRSTINEGGINGPLGVLAPFT
jgi:hypothetical protein